MWPNQIIQLFAFFTLFSLIESCPNGTIEVSIDAGPTGLIGCAIAPICVGQNATGNCPPGSFCTLIQSNAYGCKYSAANTTTNNITTIIPSNTTNLTISPTTLPIITSSPFPSTAAAAGSASASYGPSHTVTTPNVSADCRINAYLMLLLFVASFWSFPS
jgi:hypothetical protein